ncbi:amino acid adenylation domain-containing protein [Ruminococcus albus]|uniref:Amino acid adenylation domain-containing protein n=1 Tax=Ruminococcus albus TaxID=1264 RepID=A0A1I1ETK3_RUMAL|nr:amino acid adenylation domain-containing protein [Ruminococcus albus]SFB90444.1 amino acid adenylation domain-containing protein [Ruminococcus albus]
MELNVLRLLEKTADRFNTKIAYSDSDESLSFSEVTERAKRIGSALAEKIPARCPVAVMSGRRVHTPVIFLGIVYAGCFYAPMDSTQPKARLRDILSVLQPKLLIADEEGMKTARELGFEGEILSAEELAAHEIDQPALDERARYACADDPLYVIFTSGSTGKPKGVITSMMSLMCYISAYLEVMKIDDSDVLGNQSPLDYIAAVRDIYVPIFTGASMFIIPKQCFMMPAELFRVMNERKITAVGWSVSVFTIAVKLKAFEGEKPEYLRKVCFSGSVMPCSALRVWQKELPECKFVNQYGPTECTASCTYHEVDGIVEEGDTLPIGRPYRNYRVFLLDDENKPVKTGEQGEICVSGPILALGYYNNKELTDGSFIQHPLNGAYNELIYKTGDYGIFDESGILWFKGRKDRQIKHLGHRVELSEIENAALRLESIRECCAMYLKEKELIYLFYTGTATVKEAAVHFRGILPGFMVPRKLIQLEELPRLANGKTDMRTLADMMK